MQDTPLYVTDVSDATEIGVVDPDDAVSFTFTAKHGNAFSTGITVKYEITWIFSLA